MKQKISALVLVTALLGAFLVGCSSKPAETAGPASDAQSETSSEQSESTESTDGTGITLKWQQWWQVECPDGYVEALVEEYEKQTGVRIELLSAPFADTKAAITAGASTGMMADIVSIYGTWVYEFADQGILANMSELMAADGFDRSTIASEWQVLGETYALPIINFAYPMYANQDILDEAGVTSLPATWSEFEDACAKIKAAGYYPFAISLDTTSPTGIQNSWMGFAWGSGIKMQAEDGTCRVAGNEGLAEFSEYIKERYDKGYIYPGMSALTEAEMSSKFCAGEIAFHINSKALLPSCRTEAPDMNITAMPVPVKDGYTDQQGVGVASWALGISEQSEHKA